MPALVLRSDSAAFAILVHEPLTDAFDFETVELMPMRKFVMTHKAHGSVFKAIHLTAGNKGTERRRARSPQQQFIV